MEVGAGSVHSVPIVDSAIKYLVYSGVVRNKGDALACLTMRHITNVCRNAIGDPVWEEFIEPRLRLVEVMHGLVHFPCLHVAAPARIRGEEACLDDALALIARVQRIALYLNGLDNTIMLLSAGLHEAYRFEAA